MQKLKKAVKAALDAVLHPIIPGGTATERAQGYDEAERQRIAAINAERAAKAKTPAKAD